jgi:hypothetical protein
VASGSKKKTPDCSGNLGDVEVRHAYSPRIPYTYSSEEPSLTHQSFKDELDINNILKKHAQGVPLPYSEGASYGEVEAQTFHEAMNIVTEVQSRFLELPAVERSKFGNDPLTWLNQTEEKNTGEAEKPASAERTRARAPDEPDVDTSGVTPAGDPPSERSDA